jgi:hypothetical protein
MDNRGKTMFVKREEDGEKGRGGQERGKGGERGG